MEQLKKKIEAKARRDDEQKVEKKKVKKLTRG